MPSPYTSARSGLFDASDVDSWGQGIGVYPNTASDVFTVAAGHEITINGVFTHELGASTVNGKLLPSKTANSQLIFGHANLTFNSGSEYGYSDLSVVPKEYTHAIMHNPTSDNAVGIVFNNGAKVYLRGDPALVGSVYEAELNADWTSGQSFVLNAAYGDLSAKWLNGHELYVHKNALYASSITDFARVTINTVSWNGTNSTVTINEAFPTGTFKAGGKVLNITRNVRLGKLNAVLTVGNVNTLRPRIIVNQTIENNLIELQDVDVQGVVYIYGGANHKWINCNVRNSSNGLNATTNCTVTNAFSNSIGLNNNINCMATNVFANAAGLNPGNSCTITNVFGNNNGLFNGINCTVANLFSNNNGFSSSINCTATNVFNNTVGFSSSTNCTATNIFGNSTGIYNSTNCIVTGSMGWNLSSVSTPNTNDFRVDSSFFNTKLKSIKLPQAGLTFSNRNHALNYRGQVLSENHGQVLNAHMKYEAFADVIKNDTILRTGGALSSIEIIPLSNMTAIRDVQILGVWIENDVPSSLQVRLMKIRGAGWTGFPANTQLYFQAEYLNHATLLTTATVKSTVVLSDNTTWVDFPVSFTPLQAGKVIYTLHLNLYQASAKVYADNALYNQAIKSNAFWSDGESHLLINQSAWTPAAGGGRVGILTGGQL